MFMAIALAFLAHLRHGLVDSLLGFAFVCSSNSPIDTSHGSHDIRPQVIFIIFIHGRTGMSHDEVRRGSRTVPNTSINLMCQLSRYPSSMALYKECIGRIESIVFHFVGKFVGTTNKDAIGKFLGAFDFSKAVKNGKLFREARSAIGNGSILKSTLERPVQVGFGFCCDSLKILFMWSKVMA